MTHLQDMHYCSMNYVKAPMTHLQDMHCCSMNYVKAPMTHLQGMHYGSMNYVWLLWFYYKIILLVLYALIYI